MRCPDTTANSRDAGFTLVELLISLMLLAVVAVVFGNILISALRSENQIALDNAAADEARVILAQVDREFRAANAVCAPIPGGAGTQLTFLSNASGSDVRIDYRVDGTVFQRAESTDIGVPPASWTDLEIHLANTAAQPPFTLRGDTAAAPGGGRVLDIDLWVDLDPGQPTRARLIESSFTARNIFLPEPSACT